VIIFIIQVILVIQVILNKELNIKSKNSVDKKCMHSVKVGPKGQIVIPKEIRDMFAITPGTTLLMLADSEKGIAIERLGVFSKIADAIFNGRAKEIYPDKTEEDSLQFAKKIEEIKENGESDTND